MDKISSFKILSLSLSGFKCFGERQDFELGDVTMITGANHVGKSTLAEAVAFAVTGATLFGEKHIDRLYSEQNPDVEVRMTFCDQNGATHELIRKRRNDKMSIVYDGYNIRQADLTDLFGDRDVFLSIFNPLYFIEVLGDEGKALLERYLPFIDHETVMEGISDYSRSLLANKDILAPEVTIKNLREEVRDLKDGIIAYEGQGVLLMKQRGESAQALNLLKCRSDNIVEEIAALEAKKSNGISKSQLQGQLDELTARYDEMLSDRPTPIDTAETEKQLRDCELTLERTAAKTYESKFVQQIAETQAGLNAAYDEHKRISTVISRLSAGTSCPICLRAVTDSDVAGLKEQFAPDLKEVIARGRGLKGQLSDLAELDTKAKETFEQFKNADTEKYIAQISLLRSTLHDARSAFDKELSNYESVLSTLSSQVQVLNEQLDSGNLDATEINRLAQLYDEQHQVQADYAAQETLYKQQTDNTKEKIAEAEKQIKHKETLISAVADYAAKRAALTFEKLSAGKVSFKLFDVVKSTGEVRDCFRFTYNGRDYRRLSRSERVLAGVSTAELIKSLTGRNYPVFIDDSESVTNIPKPTGQALLARVVPKTSLSVKYTENAVELKKAG